MILTGEYVSEKLHLKRIGSNLSKRDLGRMNTGEFMLTYVRAMDQNGQVYVLDTDGKIATIPHVGDRITTWETFQWYLLIRERQINYGRKGELQVSLTAQRIDVEREAGHVDGCTCQ